VSPVIKSYPLFISAREADLEGAAEFGCIKGVDGVTYFVEDKISDINNVIDAALADTF
jgi:hypothetical protein